MHTFIPFAIKLREIYSKRSVCFRTYIEEIDLNNNS